jgi:hypothetical protein
MKIKDFIKELQKCNPEGEIFTEDITGLFSVTGVIDYTGDEESYIIEQERFSFSVN